MNSLFGFVSGSARTRALNLAAILAVCALALVACGGKQQTAASCRLPDNQVAPGGSGADSIDEKLAEIDAYPRPEGVEPELWETLKSELAKRLRQKTATQMDEIEINLSGERGYGVGVAWDNEFLRADGSGNGVVDIADLTPIAIHYGWEGGYYEYHYADYNDDHAVNLADIVVLARSFGLSCSGFCVEFSNKSESIGFSVAGILDYDDYARRWDSWRRIYEFPCETRGMEPLWVRVWALDKTGYGQGFQVWEAPLSELKGPITTYYLGDFELTNLETQPPAVAWSTANLIPDGNQDGVTNRFDLWILAPWFGTYTNEEPLGTVVDYSRNGNVGIEDVSGVAVGVTNGYSVGSFAVEVSATSAEDGFLADGTVDYFDSAGFNEFGFRYYEYEIAAPPEAPTYWVRVVPYSVEDERGAPGTAVQVES